MKPTESTASTSASTSASHDRIGWCLLIFVFAIAIRLAAMWPLLDSALFDTIMGDAINYDSWARRIAGGDWIGEEVFYQAPLYPYFLGTLYWIVGDDLLVVRWV